MGMKKPMHREAHGLDRVGVVRLGRFREPRHLGFGGCLIPGLQACGCPPSRGSMQGLEQQIIRELGHRNPAVPGLMVEGGNNKPGDHGRVVSWPWHVQGCS